MKSETSKPSWERPTLSRVEGRYVIVSRLNPDADVDDLYRVSHEKEEDKSLWTFMHYGPFRDKNAMYEWLLSVQESSDPMFYAIFSKELKLKVGMIAIQSINAVMGRAELAHVWYTPLVQKTKVNTEVVYLFLKHLFDELHYRRVEWKCDEENIQSKRAALRLGFSYEGLFRQHMIVKGKNRDTAWFSIIDKEWPERKKNFERYFSSDGLALRKLNLVDANILP